MISKGNGLYCYVTLNAGEKETGELERDLKLWVRKQIGPLATPDLFILLQDFQKQGLEKL
jgi:acyl-coenzyme A synthetase/AMP-(fatty) acid ligase